MYDTYMFIHVHVLYQIYTCTYYNTFVYNYLFSSAGAGEESYPSNCPIDLAGLVTIYYSILIIG